MKLKAQLFSMALPSPFDPEDKGEPVTVVDLFISAETYREHDGREYHYREPMAWYYNQQGVIGVTPVKWLVIDEG